jgi:hypothetical protein
MDDSDPEQVAFIQPRRASSLSGRSNGVSSRAVDPTTQIPRPVRRKRRSPWPALIIGMLLMVSLVVGCNALGSWWQMHQEDVTYGRPRTFQLNAVVGHDDSAVHPSHFIFLNLNGQVIIVEFPGGNAARAITYNGPTLLGNNASLIPITGSFKDVNGDGRPDMLVLIQSQTLVFINTGTAFRPLQPGTQITV